jgi:hypothetical protein
MLHRGSVHMPASIHEAALLHAVQQRKTVRVSGYLQLFEHQKEDVICMGAVEKMKAWKPLQTKMVTNVGILCEPPGSGKMFTMAAHLLNHPPPDPKSPFVKAYDKHKSAPGPGTTVRGPHTIELIQTQTYVAPIYLPIAIVVAHHLHVATWATTLAEVGHQRVVAVSSQVELRDFDKIRDSLNDVPERAYDVVVVSTSFFGAVASRLRFMRVSRLIIDDVLSCAPHAKVACCFAWFIEDQPAKLLDQNYQLPTILKESLGPLYLDAINDPSPIFVFHSKAEVHRSLQIEYPQHMVYHISDEYGAPSVSNLPVPKSPLLEDKLVVAHQIPVWTWESAPSMVRPAVKDRLESELASDDGCMVCTESYERARGACCLLVCCTRLLCCTCTWKIINTSGTCPTCRVCISDKEASVVMISNRQDVPINVSHLYIPHITDKMVALVLILSRIGLGDRVVIFSDCADNWIPGTETTVQQYLEHQMSLSILRLTGRALQMKPKLSLYQGASPVSNRAAVLVTPHQSARGLNLDATTHVIFYSTPSLKDYEHVMSRVLNASTRTVARRNGRRLKVHMLLQNCSLLPSIYTSQEGVGLGRGGDGEAYDLRIASDIGSI